MKTTYLIPNVSITFVKSSLVDNRAGEAKRCYSLTALIPKDTYTALPPEVVAACKDGDEKEQEWLHGFGLLNLKTYFAPEVYGQDGSASDWDTLNSGNTAHLVISPYEWKNKFGQTGVAFNLCAVKKTGEGTYHKQSYAGMFDNVPF